MKLTPFENRLLAKVIHDYDLVWKDRTDCLSPARTMAAYVLSNSDLEGEAYYDKEDELTEYIEELLKDREGR